MLARTFLRRWHQAEFARRGSLLLSRTCCGPDARRAARTSGVGGRSSRRFRCLVGCRGEREPEGAAALLVLLGPDASAVALDDPPARRQADPVAVVAVDGAA